MRDATRQPHIKRRTVARRRQRALHRAGARPMAVRPTQRRARQRQRTRERRYAEKRERYAREQAVHLLHSLEAQRDPRADALRARLEGGARARWSWAQGKARPSRAIGPAS